MSAATITAEAGFPVASAGTVSGFEKPIQILDVLQAAKTEKERVFRPETELVQRARWEQEGESRRVEVVKTVHIEQRAKPLLTGDAKYLFDRLLAITQTKAVMSGLRINSMRLYLFEDPEEHTTKKVVEVIVKAMPQQAIACWESIGRSVDLWREGLSSYLKERLISEWSLRVRWTGDGF